MLRLCVVVNTRGVSTPDSDLSGRRKRASRFTLAGVFSMLSEQCAVCVASVCCWLLQSASGNKAGTLTHVGVIDVGERRRTCHSRAAGKHHVVVLQWRRSPFASSAPVKASQTAVSSASSETSFQGDSWSEWVKSVEATTQDASSHPAETAELFKSVILSGTVVIGRYSRPEIFIEKQPRGIFISC